MKLKASLALLIIRMVLISFLCHAEAIQKCKNKFYLYQWHKSKLLFFFLRQTNLWLSSAADSPQQFNRK